MRRSASLIKAMLKLKIPNDKVHFYFNRADRLVSSGRITQIKQGKYGGDVVEADHAAVDAFIAEGTKVIGLVALARQAVLQLTTTSFDRCSNRGGRRAGF
jgi:hypothetical protein